MANSSIPLRGIMAQAGRRFAQTASGTCSRPGAITILLGAAVLITLLPSMSCTAQQTTASGAPAAGENGAMPLQYLLRTPADAHHSTGKPRMAAPPRPSELETSAAQTLETTLVATQRRASPQRPAAPSTGQAPWWPGISVDFDTLPSASESPPPHPSTAANLSNRVAASTPPGTRHTALPGAGSRRLEDLNLMVDAPDYPWVEVDAERFNPAACLVFVRVNPEICVVLIAERLGVEARIDLKSLSSITQARMRGSAPDARIFNERPESTQDMDGIRYEATITTDDVQLYYVVWIAVRNGYVYQLATFGIPDFAAEVEAANCSFRRRLHQIDPSRVAHVDGQRLVERFESPGFGYRVDLAGLGWTQWKDLEADFPGAEFGALRGDQMAVAVLPVRMPGRQPHLDALTTAMLARMDIVYPGEEVKQTVPYQLGTLHGQEVHVRRRSGAGDTEYRLRVVADDRCAYLIAGWVMHGAPDGLSQLGQALDRVTIVSSDLPDETWLTEKQRFAGGLILNRLGADAYGRGDVVAALEYIKAAFELHPDNETILSNYVESLAGLDRWPDAKQLLGENLARFPDSLSLRAIYAGVLAELGDTAQARAIFSQVFAQGYADEAALLAYIGLAVEAKSYDEAIRAVETVEKRMPTSNVQRWHASLYGLKGDFDRSIEMLKALRLRYPADVGVALDLAEIYAEAEQYAAGLEITQQLLDAGNLDENTLLAHGRIQMHLRRFAEAKQTFERAAELFPRSDDASEFLRYASNQLGEGDNSALKTPIDPVEIPQVVRDAMRRTPVQPAASIEKYGAEELTRVDGVAYRRNTPLRTTTYRRIKVYSPGGASRYSTLTFDLDPSSERLYVNQLVVFDAQGKRVAEGSVDSYYVVDDTSSGVASHRKVVHVPVPGLKPGHTLEYTVTREDMFPAEEFPFQEAIMSSSVPVGVSAFFVRGEVSQLKCATSMPMPVGSTGDVLHCLQLKAPPYRYESKQQPAANFVPIVWVGHAGATWEAVAREYLTSIEEKLVPDEQSRQLAIQLVRNCRTDREKLATLAAHVQQSCTYQAIEFGRRGRIPNTSAKTLQLKYGDCKDHALLLKQLLAGVGIPAHLALVNASGELVPDLPSLEQFDHMIVYVPNRAIGEPANAIGGLLIDGTEKDASALLFPAFGLADKSVLVLDPTRPRIVHTPDYPSDAGQLVSRRRITIRRDAPRSGSVEADVEEKVTFNEYFAPGIRSYLKLFEPGERPKAIQDLLSGNDQLRVRRLDVENLEQAAKPLVLRLEYVQPDNFHRVASSSGSGTLVGRLPSPWENRFLQPGYVDTRETPFEIKMPLLIQSWVDVSLPAGWQLADLDRWSSSGRTEFAAWVSQAEQNGTLVNIKYALRLSAGRHPADVYKDYYAAMKGSLAIFQAPLTVREQVLETASRRANVRRR